eukprot:jgi/Psemu1/323721/estExt_fgenesh1_pg.C_910018
MPTYFVSLAVIPVVASIAICYLFKRQYYDWTPCNRDPSIHIDWSGVGVLDESESKNLRYTFQDPCKLFSSDYEEARQKFHDAVESLKKNYSSNVSIFSLPVTPVGDEKTALTLDIAIIPGNSRDLGTIVHSSGVHGVEGYAGSAIQLALLEMLFSGDSESAIPNILKERPTFVLVHAVNPVGMKQYRRFNENNVDLNRNCIVIADEKTSNGNKNGHGAYRSFDEFVAQRDPNIAGYDDFRYLFVPQVNKVSGEEDPSLSLYEGTIGYFAKAIPAIRQYGMTKLKRALVSGQYHHPEGLNYGGQEWQPSIRRLFDFFVQDHPEFFRDSASLVWIDVHTGLGPFGEDSVHYLARNRAPDTGAGDAGAPTTEFRDHLTTAYSVTSENAMTTSEAFSGYEFVSGVLLDFLANVYVRLLHESNRDRKQSGVFMFQEFGTLPSILVGRGLILDNKLYQMVQQQAKESRERRTEPYSYRSPFLKYAFYPQSTEWRKMVIQKGVALIVQSTQYIQAQRKTRV